MKAKDMEKRLLAMQEEFAKERDPIAQQKIRAEYVQLHREWLAARSQMTLGAAA